MENDLISRQDATQAINLLKDLEQRLDDYYGLNDEGKAAFRMAITALELFGNAEQLPSAQPELDEWCDDCAEYDKENHSCPRFNRVIRETLDDVRKDAMAQRWKLVAEQPPKAEEEVFVYLFDPPSPYIAWISKFDGKWHTEDFTLDEEDNPIAYMPLPKPYEEKQRD